MRKGTYSRLILEVTSALLFKAVVIISMLTASSCSIDSGTWSDDPSNWYRVYGDEKPDQIEVVHSYYWRSSHWTVEYAYFFQAEYNHELVEGFFTTQDLKEMTWQSDQLEDHLFGEKPHWFAPKALTEYEIWHREHDHFTLLIDRTSKMLFWCAWQV